MRELTAYEVEEVSGGFLWFIACGAAMLFVGGGAYGMYSLGRSHGAAGAPTNYNFMGVTVTASQCVPSK